MELYLIWLTKIFHKYQDIYNFIDAEDIENVFNSNSINLELPESIKSSLLSSKLKDEAKYEYDYCLKNGIKLITFNSPEYPVNLSHIPSPPPLLYCKGNILPKDEFNVLNDDFLTALLAMPQTSERATNAINDLVLAQ